MYRIFPRRCNTERYVDSVSLLSGSLLAWCRGTWWVFGFDKPWEKHPKRNGKIHLTEFAKQLLIKRARVVAGAKSKLSALRNCILPYSKDNHILICAAQHLIKKMTRQMTLSVKLMLLPICLGINLICELEDLHQWNLRMSVSKLERPLREGRRLQALVAIKCLDEGVNIPSIKTAFILASSTNPKEYIQRPRPCPA